MLALTKKLRTKTERTEKVYDRGLANVEGQQLREAFEKAKNMVARSNLYVLTIREIIRTRIGQYAQIAVDKIKTGSANEIWSERKIELAHQLEYQIEDVIKDDIQRDFSSGDSIRNELLMAINDYEKEYLVAERTMFNDKNKWLPTEGRWEKIYLRSIEKVIDLVFRVYRLYQVENRTNADTRISGEGTEDAVILMQLAHTMTQDTVKTLLKDYRPEALQVAERILNEIEMEHSDTFIVAAAAREMKGGSQAARCDIDPVQLLSVYKAFISKCYDADDDALKRAHRNYGSVVKHAVLGAASTAASAASALGNTGTYLTNMVCDLAIGNPNGPTVPPSRTYQDTDSDADDEAESEHEDTPVVSRNMTRPEMKENYVQKTLLTKAPVASSSQSKPPVIDDLDEDDAELEALANKRKIK